MLATLARRGAFSATWVALALLAGCSRTAPAETPPPPPQAADSIQELAGGPPPAQGDAQAPRPAAVAVPGRPEPTAAQIAWMRRHHWAPARPEVLVTATAADGRTIVSMHPVANPRAYVRWRVRSALQWRRLQRARYRAWRRSHAALVRHTALQPRPAPPAPAHAQPAALAAAPPAKAAPDARLAMVLIGPAPAGDAAAADAALDQLTAAVAQDMKALRLDIPPGLSAGRPARVVLTLPSDLLGDMQAKAAQVGLYRAARRAEVIVALSGQGYRISPDAAQSERLRPGQPAVFSWTVQPIGVRGGELTADMTGALYGGTPALTFALGAVDAQVPAAAAAAVNAPAPARPGGMLSGGKLPVFSHLELGAPRLPGLGRLHLPDLSHFHLSDLAIPGHRTIDIPGLGAVPSEKVVTTVILLLVVLLLVAISRSARARRIKAERRRRFHTFEATATSFVEDPAPEGPFQNH